jgi:hypothetical protein
MYVLWSRQASEDARGGRGREVSKRYEQFPFDLYVRFAMGAFEFHYRPNAKPQVCGAIAIALSYCSLWFRCACGGW